MRDYIKVTLALVCISLPAVAGAAPIPAVGENHPPALEQLRRDNPTRFAQLEQLKRRDRAAYDRAVARYTHEPPSDLAKELRTKMRANRAKLTELMDGFAEVTSASARNALLEDMERILGEQYDLRLRQRNEQIRRLKERAGALEEKLKAELAEKQTVVARWKQRLVGAAQKQDEKAE